MGVLIYMVACKFPHSALDHRPTVVQYIKDGKLKTNDQVGLTQPNTASVWL